MPENKSGHHDLEILNLDVFQTMSQSWVYIFKDSGAGGGGRLRINLRKVKDLVNNASILAIFSLKLCNFLQNILKNM